MKTDLDYTGAMFAFVLAMMNGIFAMVSGSTLFGLVAMGFAGTGWYLTVR